MKKVFTVLLVIFMLIGFAYASDDLAKLKTDLQSLVNSYNDNANSQQLLVEGFKATNSTYRALVDAQMELQKQARAISGKIQKLETPPVKEEPDKEFKPMGLGPVGPAPKVEPENTE